MTIYSEQINTRLKKSPLAAYYLIYIFCVLVFFDLLTMRGTQGTAWIIGDWLINYSAGFIRRGLAGEAILLTSGLLHISPIILVVLIQLSLYAWILYAVWDLVARLRWTTWLILLFLSPATLSFPVMDSSGGFRKEILYFAGLSGLLYILRRSQQNEVKTSAYLCCALAITILCHEGLAVFTPYYLGALILGYRNGKKIFLVAAIPAIVLCFALAEVVTHPGDAAISNKVCASLDIQNVSQKALVCSGAIASIGADAATEKTRVALVLSSHHAVSLYGWLLALACVPALFALRKFRRAERDLTPAVAIGGAAALSLLLSVPLFLYADDWGRWIYIHVFSIFLLLLFREAQRNDYDASREVAVEPGRSRLPRMAFLVTALLYAICWNIPHVPTYGFHTGYFGLIKHFSQFHHPKAKAQTQQPY